MNNNLGEKAYILLCFSVSICFWLTFFTCFAYTVFVRAAAGPMIAMVLSYLLARIFQERTRKTPPEVRK